MCGQRATTTRLLLRRIDTRFAGGYWGQQGVMRISFLIRNTAYLWNQPALASNGVRRAPGSKRDEGSTGGTVARADPRDVNANVWAAIAVD